MTRPFLRIPPFPHNRGQAAAEPCAVDANDQKADAESARAAIDALRRWRVGSDFWLAPAVLPEGRDVLLCASSPAHLASLVDAARDADMIDRIIIRGGIPAGFDVGTRLPPSIAAATDPWSACDAAAVVIADGDDEWALIAALSQRPVLVVGEGRFAGLSAGGRDGATMECALEQIVRTELLGGWRYGDPFGTGPITVTALVEIMGQWRLMIEANRKFAAIFGVASWKQVTTDALLWDGIGAVRYAGTATADKADFPAGSVVLAWMARTDTAAMSAIAGKGICVGEIEDGMIRSNGLGANCVPPLSIVVDSKGPHFDPAQASELETILQTADIAAPMLARAERLRETIVARGIGKYGQGQGIPLSAPAVPRRRVVLVTGQVEDDRSILCGGAGLNNLELLRRARGLEADAWIVFKPHPDVEAGHRKGHVPDMNALEHADEIDRSSSITALMAKADAVHVITSLAGFEALLRGCEVITHGVPFYAGWGLTRDYGPVPGRRSRRRTLDELVAAALILYPRYLDPVTRLPCAPELLVERIASGQASVRTARILFREVLGRTRLWLRQG